MEYIQDIREASASQSFDEQAKDYKFDIIASNANYDLTSDSTPEKISASKCMCNKSSVCPRLFLSQSRDLMSSGADVVDALINDQGNLSVTARRSKRIQSIYVIFESVFD